jgi:hypothetical protein
MAGAGLSKSCGSFCEIAEEIIREMPKKPRMKEE